MGECMIRSGEVRFGTPEIPFSMCKPSTIEGVKRVGGLGLDAMEIEFIRRVDLKPKMAKKIEYVVGENDVLLTAYALYYINLNAKEKVKVEASKKGILDSARRLYDAGPRLEPFHFIKVGGGLG